MRLSDKVAIVTGGSNGIGRAIAAVFAREGAKVVIADRDIKRGRACAQEIRAGGAEVEFVAADVSQVTDVSELIVGATKRLGGLDILINMAVQVFLPWPQTGIVQHGRLNVPMTRRLQEL